ncbi:MAG: hypothetical protein KAQ93_02890 [Spirochaetales bacterium]|nr:hypothetical protein [Spirochaetales bacterium]
MTKYLLLFIILLNGCELFTNYRTITVSLPKAPPPWFQDSNKQTGIVLYPGTSGYIESTVIEWKGSFSIEMEKGSSIPIACYPSGYLKPAGAILTTDLLPGQNLQLNWEDGFLADLLLDLMEKRISIEYLNINRLSEEIQDECEGDPWSINKNLLMDAIIYNSLSVYKIKTGELQEITIPITGEWISDNPFYPQIFSNTEENILINGFYPGLHRFQNPETRQQLDILVWGDGFEYLEH